MFLSFACSLRKEYELIADKALTTPTNTQHLMELKEAMIKAEEKELPILEEKMIESRHRYQNFSIKAVLVSFFFLF